MGIVVIMMGVVTTGMAVIIAVSPVVTMTGGFVRFVRRFRAAGLLDAPSTGGIPGQGCAGLCRGRVRDGAICIRAALCLRGKSRSGNHVAFLRGMNPLAVDRLMAHRERLGMLPLIDGEHVLGTHGQEHLFEAALALGEEREHERACR